MSGSGFSNLWAWVYPDERRLQEEGGAKAEMVGNWNAFQRYHHADFAAAEHAIELALDTARRTGERRWELLLRHWRLQLWLDDDLRRALPEAVDLLSLATDEQLRDVPQRICAFHDLVDCYVRMDAAGYCDDIIANSEDVLAQLPKRYNCADCARLHLANACGAAGRWEDAERHLRQFEANAYDASWAGAIVGQADTYASMGRWEDAERHYLRAMEQSRRRRDLSEYYLEGLLGAAQARVEMGDLAEAVRRLREARHVAKYTGSTVLLARLLEVEGYVAEAAGERAVAADYLTRAAKECLGLGRYRASALTALHCLEMAQAAGDPLPEQAAETAREAVGMMPPASRDVYTRLAALGLQPIAPSANTDASTAKGPALVEAAQEAEGEQARRELQALQETLAGHLKSGNPQGTAVALYRLGRWHMKRREPRAAVDYLIANAALERLLELDLDDREDALNALTALQKELPVGAVRAALAAAEEGPSPLLAPMLGEIKPERWRWLVRSVATELDEGAVVEPEPVHEEGAGGFDAWLEHVASMTALIVRLSDRADLAKCERWAAMLDETADEIRRQVGPNGEGQDAVTLARAIAALSRGEDPAQTLGELPAEVAGIIERIRMIAGEPVWHHPGCSPLDFLVEHAAQRAVRGLRLHDDHRTSRLANLAFRFQLMALDLEAKEQLHPIARFLDALGELMVSDGVLADPLPTLDAPFDSVLRAVSEAGASAGPA